MTIFIEKIKLTGYDIEIINKNLNILNRITRYDKPIFKYNEILPMCNIYLYTLQKEICNIAINNYKLKYGYYTNSRHAFLYENEEFRMTAESKNIPLLTNELLNELNAIYKMLSDTILLFDKGLILDTNNESISILRIVNNHLEKIISLDNIDNSSYKDTRESILNYATSDINKSINKIVTDLRVNHFEKEFD